jgi:hypothetical protein
MMTQLNPFMPHNAFSILIRITSKESKPRFSLNANKQSGYRGVVVITIKKGMHSGDCAPRSHCRKVSHYLFLLLAFSNKGLQGH